MLLLAGLFMIYYLKPFSCPEIVLLDHMTEYKDGNLDQICLVKNPPVSSGRLLKLIEEYNISNPTPNGIYKRLFIKKHDYIFLPALTLSENIDYFSKNTSRDDLGNIDFLGESSCKVDVNGEPIKKSNVYVGAFCYYKK